MSGWSNRFSIQGCLVAEERARRWPSANRLKPRQELQQCCSEMDPFGKADVQKMEIETRPFGKELNAATPWRHRMGIGLLREGPLGRVLPQRAL